MVTGDWAPIRGFAGIVADDPQAVYGDLLPDLRQSDLCIVNLESPLTDKGAPISKDGPNLRGDPAAISSLEAVPFHIACLANNHMLDYGPEGLRQTMRLLGDAGIESVGAELSPEDAFAPLVVRAGGIHLGVINFCEGEDCTTARDGPGVFGWEIARVQETVEALAAQTDAVVVIAHCGREYTPLPPPYVVHAFHRIADAGADIVIGHHPHVPQGIEQYRGCPILYSLGNFCFDQPVDLFYRKAGYMVELELSREGLAGFRIIPYTIGPGGLTRMVDPVRSQFLDRLRRVSEPLGDESQVREAWEAFIDRLGEDGLRDQFHRMVGDGHLSPAQWPALRNRFVTPAHRELCTDAMTRIIRGEMGSAAGWARALVHEWCTLTVEEGLRVV
jgi:poly-gamma-glutamate synthesis protein (capsule biosynthesis protein)